MRRRNLGDIVPLYVPPNPQPAFVDPSVMYDPTLLAMYPPGYTIGSMLPDPNNEPNFAALQQAGQLPAYAGGLNYSQRQSLAQQALMRGNNPFRPTPILPDAILPPALQRVPPRSGPSWVPNGYDLLIQREARIWRYVTENGGLKSCCRLPELGAPIYDDPPWEVAPSNGSRYEYMYSIDTTTLQPYDGTDRVVGQFQVPIGYDGVIDKVVFGFSGSGFTEFSGDIIWRLKIGQRYAKGLGHVLNTYGTFANALFSIPSTSFRTISGQNIQILVNIPTGSPVAGQVQGGLFGYNYPRR